jgi:hypothetical protein
MMMMMMMMMMIMLLFTLNRLQRGGVTKSNPIQKCRPAKGVSKRLNIQIIKGSDITEQPNNK